MSAPFRVYVATSYSAKATARRLMDAIEGAGMEVSYDWTVHGDDEQDRLEEIAWLEVGGVLSSDAVVVLLPGARGTHTEMGLAIGSARCQRVLLASFEPDSERDLFGHVCPFYRHTKVASLAPIDSIKMEEVIENVLRALASVRALRTPGGWTKPTHRGPPWTVAGQARDLLGTLYERDPLGLDVLELSLTQRESADRLVENGLAVWKGDGVRQQSVRINSAGRALVSQLVRDGR